MRLTGRLNLIAQKIPKCTFLCDIGTDHAYIPIYAVKHQLCDYAIASDVVKGPVDAAKKNIKVYGLESHIEARLGDGLDQITDKEAEVIVIAGMGGNLMCSILSTEIEKAKHSKKLILQPMSEIENMRKWLYDNGFDIEDEEMVMEGHKMYEVICVKWTSEVKTLDPVYYHIGKRYIEKKDPLLLKLLEKKIIKFNKILHGMAKMENRDYGIEREIDDLKRKMQEIKKAISL